MCSAVVSMASLCKQNRPKHNIIILYDTRYCKNTDGFNKTYNYIQKHAVNEQCDVCRKTTLRRRIQLYNTTLPAGEFGPRGGGQLPTGVGGGVSRSLPDGHRVLHATPPPPHPHSGKTSDVHEYTHCNNNNIIIFGG